ncbi:MAG TPA: hypothetical protein VKG05_14525 [Steroidobacteraceae bacterium]|nr:hypothetical protein [Steroidobacteraceae bacterium]
MIAAPVRLANLNVARTRVNLPAPKFWPTIGAVANATAIAGRKIDQKIERLEQHARGHRHGHLHDVHADRLFGQVLHGSFPA